MTFLITTRNRKLLLDGQVQEDEDIYPFIGNGLPERIKEGCLSMEPTIENIVPVCDYLLKRFMCAGGVFLPPKKESPDWKGYTSLNVTTQYKDFDEDGDWNPFTEDMKYNNPDNITRGWCYLISGTLHRFFYKSWDMYRSDCKIDDDDFHWWLQDIDGNIIDLTEEQYINHNIHNCRDGGKKRSSMGQSYGVKTRNMAILTMTDMFGAKFDRELVRVTGYKKQ